MVYLKRAFYGSLYIFAYLIVFPYWIITGKSLDCWERFFHWVDSAADKYRN